MNGDIINKEIIKGYLKEDGYTFTSNYNNTTNNNNNNNNTKLLQIHAIYEGLKIIDMNGKNGRIYINHIDALFTGDDDDEDECNIIIDQCKNLISQIEANGLSVQFIWKPYHLAHYLFYMINLLSRYKYFYFFYILLFAVLFGHFGCNFFTFFLFFFFIFISKFAFGSFYDCKLKIYLL